MTLITIFGIALALAMDAFAVSLAAGVTLERITGRHLFRFGFHFGLFQGMMPVIGWLAGISVQRWIADYDHWIAFGLLLFVGARMIYESLFKNGDEGKMNTEDLPTLVMLSIATSIDALAVGLSLSLLKVDIIAAASLIGVVTFSLSFAGVLLGRRTGRALGKRVEVLGGVILMGIGLKILLSHLA